MSQRGVPLTGRVSEVREALPYLAERHRLPSTALTLARRKPLGAFGLFLILVLFFTAATADWIAPYHPFVMESKAIMKPPSLEHPMGTDNYGRDLLSRIIHGSRISLSVGIMAIFLSTVTGSCLGLISGYFEGKVDLIIQRFIDAKMAFPVIILATAILAALGPGLQNVILAVGIAGIANTTRVVRSAVLKEKHNVYIEAARCLGCNNLRIMFLHILPNVTAPIIIVATVGLGTAIIMEASLSFLGLGPSEPTPSWGLMLTGGARMYLIRAPWMAIFPGLAISLAVMGWNLLGDALRDLWDPRLRGTQG